MVAYKRRSTKRYGKKSTKRTTRPKQAKLPNVKSLARMVRKITLKSQETKKSVALNPLVAKTTQLENGEITYLDNSPLYTTQGTADPNVARTGNRIGDEVIPVGLSIKFMVGLQYQQSQVRFKWLLIRHSPGDLPVDDSLFTFSDMAVNRQLCSVDTERFTIIAQRNFTINALNRAAGTSNYTSTQIYEQGGVVPTGTVYGNPEVNPLGMASKIVSVWVPGYKFGKVLRYQNASGSPKNFSYTSIIIPYSNMYGGVQSLLQGGSKVARMDDYISQFYYKDA